MVLHETNKVNRKHSGKTGGQCYVRSFLEKIVVESTEQLADWKIPFDMYHIRCLSKEYLDRTGQFTRFQEKYAWP